MLKCLSGFTTVWQVVKQKSAILLKVLAQLPSPCDIKLFSLCLQNLNYTGEEKKMSQDRCSPVKWH